MGTVRHYDAVFESARDCGFRLTGGKAMMDTGHGLPAGLRETTRGLARREPGAAGALARHAGRPAALRLRAALRPLLHRAAAARRWPGWRGSKGVRIHTHASENRHRVRRGAPAHRPGQRRVLPLAGADRPARDAGPLRVAHRRGAAPAARDGDGRVPLPQLQPEARLRHRQGARADGRRRPCLPGRGRRALQQQPGHLPGDAAGGAAAQAARGAAGHAADARAGDGHPGAGRGRWGWRRKLGSLEEGKRADVTVVDVRGLHALPTPESVLGVLVHAARSTDVCTWPSTASSCSRTGSCSRWRPRKSPSAPRSTPPASSRARTSERRAEGQAARLDSPRAGIRATKEVAHPVLPPRRCAHRGPPPRAGRSRAPGRSPSGRLAPEPPARACRRGAGAAAVDRGAVVAHGEVGGAVLLPRLQPHAAARGRVAQGVGDEVLHHPREQRPVALEHQPHWSPPPPA